MKTCPKCAQEFEDFAADCPDCEVPLTAPGGGRATAAAVMLLMADPMAATVAREALMEAEVAFLPRSVPGTPFTEFVFDPADAERARLILAEQRTLRAGTGAGGSAVYTHQEVEVDGSEPAWAALPALPRDPEQAVPLLAEALRRGAPAVRAAAAARLAGSGRPGLDALAQALTEFLMQSRDAAVFSVTRELRERPLEADVLRPVVAVACDASEPLERRLLALHALGRFELPKLGRHLVALIDDPIPEIREAADETLCCLTDEDLGFDPHLTSDERRAFLPRWDAVFRRQGA
ncbi:MAG: hypothetical protein IPH13_13105 [Planctomycetes bacterium]|nr:hypothetical protein [Planctomycetota bacterium]MCC7172908.1 hypothetical protein [Planctomycetota bacterium]